MKRLAIVVTALALNGCALWDAYFMTKYDPNEYLLVTEIRTDAQRYKKQCDNHLFAATNAVAISNKTDLFEKYSEQILIKLLILPDYLIQLGLLQLIFQLRLNILVLIRLLIILLM